MYPRDTYIILFELNLVVCCSSLIGVGQHLCPPIGLQDVIVLNGYLIWSRVRSSDYRRGEEGRDQLIGVTEYT